MALSIKIRRTPNAELPMGTPRLLRNLDNYRVSWQRAKPLSLASEMLQLGGGVEDSRGATRGASVGMTQPACADLFRGSLPRISFKDAERTGRVTLARSPHDQ